jgi:tetratricopeptide (TPR) repeat protein
MDEIAQLGFLQARIRILLAPAEFEETVDERSLHEVLKLVARSRTVGLSQHVDSWFDLYEAMAREHLGNHLFAAKRYADLESTGLAAGTPDVALGAVLNLGRLRRGQQKTAQAIACFERAASLASDLNVADAAFDAHWALFQLAASDVDRASLHMRRCERFYPLVTARTPRLRQFEGARGQR